MVCDDHLHLYSIRILSHSNLVCGFTLPGLQHTTTLNFFTFQTTQQQTDVVTLFSAIQQLAEHLNTGTGGCLGIRDTQTTTCTGVEMFRKLLDRGEAGDNVGLLLRGLKREEVERGQVCCKPGSVKPHTKFECEVYVLSKDEGGRHTPFFNNYRPQFYFRTTDVTGACDLPEGTEMVMPGDNVKMTVTLINPIAMEEGLRFAIREGGRTVGAGVVAKIIE